jgi:hypothetical protein
MQQLVIINRLKLIIIIFGCLSFANILEVIVSNYTYEENPEKGTFYCDSPIFNGSFSMLNGVFWFIFRGLNTFPPVVLSIFMFKKKK